jgi:arylsulfatase A-like enzyme
MNNQDIKKSKIQFLVLTSLNLALLFAALFLVFPSSVFPVLTPEAQAKTANSSTTIKASSNRQPSRSNVIFILTDDLDRDTFNKQTMPRTISFIQKQGTTLQKQVFPMASCCPSRASFLSGQYNHNNDVLANGGQTGGYQAYYQSHRDQGIGPGYNIGSFFQNAGYQTAFIGKYMNTYGDQYIVNQPGTSPKLIPGWDKWFVPIQNRSQKYYNYKVRFNEPVRKFKPLIDLTNPQSVNQDFSIDPSNKIAFYNAPQCNQADNCSSEIRLRQTRMFSERIFVNQTIDFLEQQDSSVGIHSPAFIWYSTDTPHGTGDQTIYNHKQNSWGGPSYSPQQINQFNNLKLNKTGAFNELNIQDKPRYIRQVPSFNNNLIEQMINLRKSRWRSAASLDQQLGRLYSYLQKSGKIRNTILVFTSDNGFMSGQHRIPRGKSVPYRETIEFPIIYRGPGVAKNKSSSILTANIDFLPTILKLTNIPQTAIKDPDSGKRMPVDGVDMSSFLKPGKFTQLNKTSKQRKAVVIESLLLDKKKKSIWSPFQPYKGLITQKYTYIKYYKQNENSFYNCLITMLCVTGVEELYQTQKDPFQKKNLIFNIRKNENNLFWIKKHSKLLNNYYWLKAKFEQLKNCSGIQCAK